MPIKRHTSSKRVRQRNHAIRRCRERYEIELTIEDYLKLCDRIWNCVVATGGRGVERIATLRENLFFIYFRKTAMIVAWDEATCQIATFLYRSRPVAVRQQDIAFFATRPKDRWRLSKAARRGAREAISECS